MPRVAIEYVILAPLLLLQVIIFPMVASTMTENLADSRRQIALQDAGNHLASTVQQLYLSLSQREISTGVTLQASDLPSTIESRPYTAEGSLGPPLDPEDPNSVRVLTISLNLVGPGITAEATTTLPSNVQWDGGTFRSDSSTASVKVTKLVDGFLFSFG